MAVPNIYQNRIIPFKYFLASYRALCDGRAGLRHLEQMIESCPTLLSEWKIVWIGTCTTLRTAIDIFRVDAKSCLPEAVRREINIEWNDIKTKRPKHLIFWDFLRRERDAIIHSYEWQAYEVWIKPDGTHLPPALSLVLFHDDDTKPFIMMRDGPYKGQNSLDLLNEAADWVEARIFGAIRRAGFEPDEYRRMTNFELPKALSSAISEEPTSAGEAR